MIPLPEILDRLATGKWRLRALPTMSGPGIYLIHHQGSYYWLNLDRHGRSASRYQRMDRGEALAFLTPYCRGSQDSYPARTLQRWRANQSPSPTALRAALAATESIAERLRAEPGRACVRVMERRWMWKSRWFGWLTCLLKEEGSPDMFPLSRGRAHAEILSMLLKDPAHDFEALPEALVAFRDDFVSRAAELFEAHGPAPDRILWVAVEEETGKRSGLLRNARGFFVELALARDDDTALQLYQKMPTEKAHEALFRWFERGQLTLGSLPVTPALARVLASVADCEGIAGLLAAQSVELSCGRIRPGQWVSDSPETLLDTYQSVAHPVRQALRPFVEEESWCTLRFTPLRALSALAREADAPDDATTLRYTIPLAWARRFERDKLIEEALCAVLGEAVGYTGAWSRRQEQGPERDHAPTITVTLSTATSKEAVQLRLYPLESGMGVHGQRISATFQGLPEGLGIAVDGRLDMRHGGHLHLGFETADAALAARLKQSCLARLP